MGLAKLVLELELALALAVMKAEIVVGGVYTVGDEEKWSSQANYETWANQYNFSVGDILVFRYVKGEHNVYEVREEVYRTCEAGGGGIVSKYESGEDEVQLKDAGKYWFICNVAGHCLGGMRFGISVLNRTAPPASAAAFTTPPPPIPSPNSSPSISYLLPYSISFTITVGHLLSMPLWPNSVKTSL